MYQVPGMTETELWIMTEQRPSQVEQFVAAGMSGMAQKFWIRFYAGNDAHQSGYRSEW